MAGRIEARLEELGIELPQAATPAANYVPYVITGNLVFVAGQITFWNGTVKYVGKVGEAYSVADGQQAARLCGLNLIAQVKGACGGDLDRVRRCVKLGVFVNCIDGFDRHPEVANGASDLMVDVFGEAGRHARFAVGAPALPRNVATEADGVFEIA
ncbi:MAG: RidA family protein [Alphaproteobacteria bacterium]|jgi:enamine deaminase RidA (YjgF/YER057c/UK114 family)|nr:RidA family protein [Alphaproteobacteria bacterium]MDP6517174.1 RidA family protein [Alphaproteobacteria bacterium]|tara:strand:- start:147 stop:614 length:468 start_codon:yes stop_codon:yes gene_type:complete